MEALAALALIGGAAYAASEDLAARVVHAASALLLLTAWSLAAPTGRELARPPTRVGAEGGANGRT